MIDSESKMIIKLALESGLGHGIVIAAKGSYAIAWIGIKSSADRAFITTHVKNSQDVCACFMHAGQKYIHT